MPVDQPVLPEAGIEELREEIQRLRARLAASSPLPAQVTKDHSQDRFRTVFENSPLGQKIIADDLTIQQVNDAVVAMLGYTRPEDLIGRRILEFSHSHFREDWIVLQKRLWAREVPHFSLETCLVRADGSSFWCQVTSVLVSDESGELGYSILEDTSERKGLEAKLKRVYDAQETILQLTTHDLKAPIAQIELLVDLLQRELLGREQDAASPPTEMQQYFHLIQQACSHANVLMEDVLYIGELESGEMHKAPENMNAFLLARQQMHQVAAQEKGVTLELNLPEQVLYTAINPAKLSRVLDNLLSNAFKFTPAGGKVTISLEEQDQKTLLRVQDTGIGIPGKLHAHLFDKFNPARRAGLQGETTTGLGLFIARQIVELHEGHIWLESREQEGTTFFVELP